MQLDKLKPEDEVVILRRAIVRLSLMLADEIADKSAYPNEVSLRLMQPQGFLRFRREQNYFLDGIHAVFGFWDSEESLPGHLCVDVQAIRVDKYALLREG